MIKISEKCISDTLLEPVKFRRGQSVKIIDGPLFGHRGKLIDYNGKKRVQLELEDISMGFLVEIPIEQLQLTRL